MGSTRYGCSRAAIGHGRPLYKVRPVATRDLQSYFGQFLQRYFAKLVLSGRSYTVARESHRRRARLHNEWACRR